MLTSLLGFVLICLNCLRVGCQLNTSSNMGAYFLVQAPHAQGGNVKLILYTMVSDPIDIIVSVPGFPEVYEKLVNIHRPRLGSADLPEYFTTDQPGFIWTAVARSTDGSLFGVAVYIPNKEDAIAIMVAAPVISFGDLYYIVTLGNGSFFSVLAPNNMTEVTIDVINPSREFKVGVNNQTFSHGTQNSFYLLEEQAFILQVPGCNEISKGGLTGTRVSADKPVGVITGNCRTKTSNITCGDSEDFSDMTLAGYVVIVAAVANTTVMIHHYDLDDEPMTLVLEEPGNFVEERGPDRNSRLLKANFPVACYYVGVSPCMGKDRGGPFLTAVVPNELQLNAYLLR